MVDSVVKEMIIGIATKIGKIYNNKYPIYTDAEQQGVDKPCFFIKYLKGNENREIGLQDRFYKDKINFVIIGYTEDGNSEVLYDMVDRLYELEYIELTDKTLLKANKLHPEIEDGVLHFFVDYEIFIKKESETMIGMDNCNLIGGIKNEED